MNARIRITHESTTTGGTVVAGEISPGAPVAPLPGNVRLATTRDFCASCQRTLNINEPIYCGPRGTVVCAACHDVVPAVSDVVVPDPRAPIDLRTSELMRRSAALLMAMALPGAAKEVARQHANELHGRAFELEKAAIDAHRSCGVVHTELCDQLRLIGEVRS